MTLNPIFDQCFEPLYGKYCWQVEIRYGSFITLEFGEPHLEVREPQPVAEDVSPRVRELFARRQVTIRGDWHLWIYCCHWRISDEGKLVGESNQNEHFDEVTDLLDGQALTRVAINPDNCQCVFEFDLGGRLATHPYEVGSDVEQWYLYLPDEKVLSLRADKKFSYSDGKTPINDENWQPAWT